MKATICAAALAALLTSAATASESKVVRRSAATGVLSAAVPPSQEPTTPQPPLSLTYGGNRLAFGIGESVLLMPNVAGGSGRHEWALAAVTPLPAGLTFDSATGVFSGRVQTAGEYHWSVLVRDTTTGERGVAVARMIVVK
ncbi:Ig domain-containing protein [Sinorhizobium meliloti]|uniref:Ig domain-containing protein n=1 Tax=Rhizobium meliloti TaxID=382 RepID=UPI000FD892AD|nr:Ig domain-containing protein [Sinorhizobium meliloti]RVO61808.1 hypothetical protein CN092_01875 [Sinorhizobium meliloti]